MTADSEHDAAVAALAGALNAGNVVLFAGAGVSMNPPAGLPNWLNLRDGTLSAVAGRSSFLTAHLDSLTSMDMVGTPGRKGMTPEVVASEIANQCAGYFESLRVLDDGAPNVGHRTIARLAKAGCLRAIVTTNFDIFIERALGDEGVEFDLYRGQDEFARFPFPSDDGPKRLSVLKVHGCLTRPDTIIATVETQARGLAENELFVLRWLQERYPFAYWGYSGWDLKINLDYLGTVSAAARAPGFFWSLHRERTYAEAPTPYVLELIRHYGSRGVRGHNIAPEAAGHVLDAAGFRPLSSPSYTTAEREAWRHAKNLRLQERLLAWADASVTETAAVMIFGCLLEIAGRAEDALGCFDHAQTLAADAGLNGLHALALKRAGDVRMGRGQLVDALDRYRQAEASAREADDSPIVGLSLDAAGRALSRMGRHDEALACFRDASRLAAINGDPLQVGGLADSIGEVHVARAEFEEALRFFERAESAYREAGAKRLLAGGLTKQGTIHRNWGDFDRAERCFQEALTISRDVIGDADAVADARFFLASLRVASGDADSAYDDLTMLEAEARRSRSDDLLLKTLPYLMLAEANRNHVDRAGALEDEYIALLREQNRQVALGRALTNHSHRLLTTLGTEAALAACEEAVQRLSGAGDRLGAALACERLGIICQEHLHQPDRAIEYFRRSISNHRNADQNPRQFVPDLLRRIAACRAQPPLSAHDIVEQAAAAEPLIADIVPAPNGAASHEPFVQVYDIVVALHKRAHEHKSDRALCLRYLNAELPLATAIGYDHQAANIYSDVGWMHVVAEEFDDALPLLREAARISREAEDTDSEILHTGNLGFALARAGREAEGLASLALASDLARRTDRRERLLWLLKELGQWFKERKDLRGLPLLEEAIPLAEESGDLSLTSELSFDAGKLCRDHGRFEEALAHRVRGARILDLLGQPSVERLLVIANLLENDLARPTDAIPYYERGLSLCSRQPAVGQQVLALLYGALRKLPEGESMPTPVLEALVEHYQDTDVVTSAIAQWVRAFGFELLAEHPVVASRVLGHGRSVRRVVGEVIFEFAKALMAGGNLDTARSEMALAEHIAIELGDKQWLGSVRRGLGDVLRAAGEHDAAMRAYADAEGVAVLAGNATEVDLIRYTMATASADRGEFDAALIYINGALAAARDAGYSTGVAHDLLKRADFLRALGNVEEAEQSLAEAIPLFREARIGSQFIEATVKRADLLLELHRAGEALEAYQSVAPMIERGGSALARQRLQEGIERARRSS